MNQELGHATTFKSNYSLHLFQQLNTSSTHTLTFPSSSSFLIYSITFNEAKLVVNLINLFSVLWQRNYGYET